jgi:hypothetical protein
MRVRILRAVRNKARSLLSDRPNIRGTLRIRKSGKAARISGPEKQTLSIFTRGAEGEGFAASVSG